MVAHSSNVTAEDEISFKIRAFDWFMQFSHTFIIKCLHANLIVNFYIVSLFVLQYIFFDIVHFWIHNSMGRFWEFDRSIHGLKKKRKLKDLFLNEINLLKHDELYETNIFTMFYRFYRRFYQTSSYTLEDLNAWVVELKLTRKIHLFCWIWLFTNHKSGG